MQENPTQSITSVFVSNISESATAKTISDFFSFCGRITDLKLSTNPGPKQAIVTFGTDSAAKTALLLTNAMIIDRPISVTLYQPVDQTTTTQASNQDVPLQTQDHKDITNLDHQVPDDQRSKTSTIASLMAAGYVLGSDALYKAKEYDDQHGVTTSILNSAQGLIAKASEIDQQYQVSSQIGAVASSLWTGAKAIDNQVHITDTATSWLSWAGQSLVQQPVINSLYSGAGQVLSEAQQLIQQEQLQRTPPGAQEGAVHQDDAAQPASSVRVEEINVEEPEQ